MLSFRRLSFLLQQLFHCLWLSLLLRLLLMKTYGGEWKDVCMFGDRRRTDTHVPTETFDSVEEEAEDVREERERVNGLMSEVLQEKVSSYQYIDG